MSGIDAPGQRDLTKIHLRIAFARIEVEPGGGIGRATPPNGGWRGNLYNSAMPVIASGLTNMVGPI
jgi:hypothetical protein